MGTTSTPDYVDLFEPVARAVLNRHRDIDSQWSHGPRKQLTLLFPAASQDGFDVGVRCEQYALYPFAADFEEWWEAPPRAPDAELVQACESCMGLVRTLLSPDARIRRVMRNGRVLCSFVEIRWAEGWGVWRSTSSLLRLWPLGERHELVQHNHLLPSRYPYLGLSKSSWGMYLWQD